MFPQPAPSQSPSDSKVSLAHFDLKDLDRRAHRAERLMNHAMDQGRWPAASHHRSQMLAVEAELQRRLKALDHQLALTPQQVA